jgi:hypothetical protein
MIAHKVLLEGADALLIQDLLDPHTIAVDLPGSVNSPV